MQELLSASAATSFVASVSGLAAITPVNATDRFPLVRTGVGYTATATVLRDYILGISGGTATIPENLTVTQALTVNGNTTLGNATTDTITATGRFLTALVPATASTNTLDLGIASTNTWRTGYFGTSVIAPLLNATTRAGVGMAAASVSTDVNHDIISAYGVRPSTSYTYPTVLVGGFAGASYVVHTSGNWGLVIARSANDTGPGNLALYHTRSTTGARTVLQDGDMLGRVNFQGVSQTGGTVTEGAAIIARSNGAISNGVLPTDLEFHTETSGNASDITYRWAVLAAGHFVPGTNGAFTIGTASLRPSTTYTGALDVSGNTTLGNAVTDTVTVTGRFNASAAPITDNLYDWGGVALRWANVYATLFTGSIASTQTVWGQTLTGNVTGSLTSVGDITGTAGVTLTATAGTLALVATGANVITMTTNGTLRGTVTSAGVLDWVGAATIGGTLGVTGVTTLSDTLTQNAATANLAQGAATAALNVGTGSGSSTTDLSIRSAAGQFAILRYRSGTSIRWQITKDSDAESGANAGSTWRLQAFDDAGAFIDNVLSAVRASAGTVTLGSGRGFTMSGILRNSATETQLGSTTGNGVIRVISQNTGTSALRFLRGTTADSGLRWSLGVDTVTESGSNAGTGYQMLARADDGTAIDTVMAVTRAAGGTIAFSSARPITGGTYNGQTISSAASFTGTVAIADDLIFSETDATIRSNTSDASDTKRLLLTGGGSPSNTRGALAILYGNENASFNGRLQLTTGNAAAADFLAQVKGVDFLAVTRPAATNILAITGQATFSDVLTVSAGGITVTGNSTITGTLGGITTLTATTLAGTLSTAAQPNITSVGTLTSLSVGAITSTGLIQTTLTTEQMRLRYDASNYFTITVDSVGRTTLDSQGTSSGMTITDAVTITGGLTVSAGNTVFQGGMTFGDGSGDTITVNGRFGSALLPVSAASANLGSTTVPWGELFIRTIDTDSGVDLVLQRANVTQLTLGSLAATFAGTITTSAPTGGAGAWELGVANVVSPTAPDRTITVEIGGTAYYIHAKTTND